jgi:DNA-binding HxlR family transcriptional regulator
MVKRTSFREADCPIARALDEIGDWWSLLIVRDAFLGVRRFGDFQRSLGVAKNILSARLRALTGRGVLEMRPAQDGGAHLEYWLTEKGEALQMALIALRQWGENNCFPAGSCNNHVVDRRDGERVQALALFAADGRRLGPRDILLKRSVAGASGAAK